MKWQLSGHLSPRELQKIGVIIFSIQQIAYIHNEVAPFVVSNTVVSLLIVMCLFRYVPICHQITYLTFSDNGLNLHCLVIDLLKTFQNPIWEAVCSCCIISIEMHVKTYHLLKVVKPLSHTNARHASLSKLSWIGT